ncbi:MAG: guanylate kinase [Oscillospiraceae bacterium]|nr:guanylate kinase [Oscillospiraceae bacterium]
MRNTIRRPGLLVVISGPSGAGKSSTLRLVMERCGDICFSVSATTRRPRPGEEEGRHYYFVSCERFEEMRRNGELLECAEYAGDFYGTPAAPVLAGVAAGQVCVLDIEARGAIQVRRCCPDSVLVFISPPDRAELERRLRDRRTESEEKIKRRMEALEEQMAALPLYDYQVVNDVLDDAARSVLSIIEAERCRTSRALV